MNMRFVNDKNAVRRRLADVVRIAHTEVRRDSPAACPPPVASMAAHSLAVCVASGKGGTGKTIFSTNIGTLLAAQGLCTALIDADFGLANSHLLLGLDPLHDVSQLIAGEKTIHEVLIEGPHGLRVLPGGSGIAELAELNEGQMGYFAQQMMVLEQETDVTLVDCSAGITRQVMNFMASAHRTVVVTTPEVTSMIDAYAVIKNIHRLRPDMPLWLVVNRTRDEGDAEAVFRKMKDVARRRIGDVDMELLGTVPHDRYVLNSVVLRRPVVHAHPRSFATACFTAMAEKIGNEVKRWRVAQGTASKKAPAYFWSLAGRRHG